MLHGGGGSCAERAGEAQPAGMDVQKSPGGERVKPPLLPPP